MVWDICLAVLGGIVQFATAYLGWRVTMKPPEEKNKWIYELSFLACGFTGIVLIAIGTYRGITSSDALRNDIADLKKGQQSTDMGIRVIEQNTSKPPTITLPSAPQHTHVEYLGIIDVSRKLGLPDLKISAGDVPSIPMAFKNAGDFPVQEPSDTGVLTLVHAKELEKAFARERKTFKFGPPSGGIPSRDSTGSFHTIVGPLLTVEDYNNFVAGNLDLCGLGAVKWSDATGQYETHFARCLMIEPDHKAANWHLLREDNEERKLH